MNIKRQLLEQTLALLRTARVIPENGFVRYFLTTFFMFILVRIHFFKVIVRMFDV